MLAVEKNKALRAINSKLDLNGVASEVEIWTALKAPIAGVSQAYRVDYIRLPIEVGSYIEKTYRCY